MQALSTLSELQSKLTLEGGSWLDELPEQLLSLKYIKPTDVVLELGGNIGRNSMIIASLLNDSKNLTVLEPNERLSQILTKNRDDNGLKFEVINSALSDTPLELARWVSRPYTGELGWTKINTIPLSNLTSSDSRGAFPSEKYNTLVADCEGALYHILLQYPAFFTLFDKVIVENDYQTYEHKRYVDFALFTSYFDKVESQPLNSDIPDFYAVWIRKNY